VIDTAAPIDAAPLKGQHRVRVSLIWESLMSHSFGPLVLFVILDLDRPNVGFITISQQPMIDTVASLSAFND
jgi:hypothetical protein